MSVPSASYSVTMRIELERASGIGAVTTAVSDAGGTVTALDVVEPNESRMIIDLTCNAIDDGHSALLRSAVDAVDGRARPGNERPHVPPPPGRDDLSRAEGLAEDPRRPVHGLHARRRPHLDGNRQRPVCREEPHHQAQHGGRRDRRLRRPRPRQHRPGGCTAGDGGEGPTFQAIRGRRRVASVPGHPGCRRDRADRRVHRPGLWWDQPRGHLGAAMLRSRVPAARGTRHPRLP